MSSMETRPFLRTLEEKTAVLREVVDKFLNAFLAAGGARAPAAQEAQHATNRLFDMLHPADRPDWLVQMRNDLAVVASNPDHANAIKGAQRVATELYTQSLH